MSVLNCKLVETENFNKQCEFGLGSEPVHELLVLLFDVDFMLSLIGAKPYSHVELGRKGIEGLGEFIIC